MKSSVKQKEVRDAILDATDSLLSRYGYKKMTIDDLAKEVGIGKGSVYLHFTSKEEIVLSHIDRIIEQLKGKLSAIAKSSEKPEARLRKMLKTRVLHRFESVQHYTQNLNDLLSAIRPNFLARRELYFQQEARIFAAVIEDGQQSGDFAAGNAAEIAESMILATNSLLPFNLTVEELGDRKDTEAKALRLADLLLQGLCSRE
ncbi:MAG TPA: TetR/AcrR family transcriptional regulator [Pyrinomonadaceae bacterium]|jgi:AcrR family transcriptional regulator|nr:TetR/AcrR family transcriptional regulator [Pyrinomonadaceae bacterium]